MFLYAFRFVLISGASVALLVLSIACLTRVNPDTNNAPPVNVEHTIEAAVAATITARPSPTSVLMPVPVTMPVPSQTPGSTPIPKPTATITVLVPTIIPTVTPTPPPPPLEVTFRRIFGSSDEAPPQFQVELKNLTERVIEEFRLEICPVDRSGQPVADQNSGEQCFVVSGDNIFQPANARPPTGYEQVQEGLYEKNVNGETLQWGVSHYPSWVGTGYESASRAIATLTYARFEDGEVWQRAAEVGPAA